MTSSPDLISHSAPKLDSNDNNISLSADERGASNMVLGDSNPLEIDETTRPKHEDPVYDTVQRPLNVEHQVFEIQPHNLEPM